MIDANERMPRDAIHLEVRPVWEMHWPVHVSRGVGASNEGRKEREWGGGAGGGIGVSKAAPTTSGVTNPPNHVFAGKRNTTSRDRAGVKKSYKRIPEPLVLPVVG